MRSRRLAAALALAVLTLTPLTVAAQGPEPIDAPAGFAELRSRFDGKTQAEVREMGYVPEPPICVSVPGVGGMGVHATNFALYSQQFQSGTMDPEQPPIVLMSADLKTVLGVEWEASDVGQGETTLYGQPVVLQPGHDGPPGTEHAHYMLHAYFRPNGQVLFAPFDPEVTCDLPDTAIDGGAAPLTDGPWMAAAPLLALVALLAAVAFGGRRASSRGKERRSV